jgi:hypothetical protein
VIIVGAGGVFVALLLSGLQHPLTRLLEGYPLARARKLPVLGKLYAWRLRHWQQVFDRLAAALDGPAGPDRTAAARRLHTCFPARRDLLLPTEFGNVLRAFETHPRLRYGLDGIAIWPRVAMLFNDTEKAEVEEASADVQFFTNLMVVTVLAGLLLAVDAAAHADGAGHGVLYVAIGLAATAALSAIWWRAAISAARRWGSPVRAAFDLHRLELYERLGVKTPQTAAEEQVVGTAVNRLLMFAEPLPDACRAPAPPKEEPDGR